MMYIWFGADGMEIVTSSKHKMFPGYGLHTQNVHHLTKKIYQRGK